MASKARNNTQQGSGVHSTAIEQISTASLIPYARNARTHSEQQISQIAGSIQEFGFCNPVLIDDENGIIAGHGRVLAAQVLKLETVPCLRLSHLTDAQKRAYVLADNRIAMSSGWDEAMLANELSDLHADDFDMALLGFDADELTKLLALDDTPVTSGEIVEDEVPEPPADPITKPGDLWLLGDHRLLCGDSTKAEDVARLMAGAKADLCFTSPPYSDQRTYTGEANLSPSHLSGFIECAARHSDFVSMNLGLSRKGGFIDPYWNEYISRAESSGLGLLSWNVWYRTGGFSVGQITAMFPIEHEFIFVFGRHPRKLVPTVENANGGAKVVSTNRDNEGNIGKKKRMEVRDRRELGTVIVSPSVNTNTEHPAQFPVALPAEYIKAFGGSVYEPFCGSGTTLIAAEQLNRKCYGMEISPAYCDVICARWAKLTGKAPTLESTGEPFNANWSV